MSALHPALRAGVAVLEMRVRGETHFVVKEPDGGRYLRMGAVEGRVLRLFDGLRSPADVARQLAADGVRISVATVEAFARTCARKGLLERTTAERSILQLERLRAERHRRRSLFRGELLRMRWSMGDPDALLRRALPYLRWCFTRAFVVASIVLLLAAALLVASSSGRFGAELGSLLAPAKLTGGRLLLVWTVLATITLVHELGHAVACKRFGGEVREMGFMLMYLQPAFYCNVNDAWSFPRLAARLWVTAAGVWIEIVFAAVAAIVWWVAQPGTLLADGALLTVFFGCGFAILANANPLLPFDGYFALSDWLGVPNLRQRGLAHWGWWVRRHALRLDVPEPVVAADERRLLLRYGALASAYIALSLAVTVVLVTVWATRRAGPLGVLPGLLLAVVALRATLGGWGATLRDAARLHGGSVVRWLAGRQRRRAAVALLVLLLVAAVTPWPVRTGGTFTATSATSTTAAVATEPGVVTAVLVREGDRVAAGQALVLLTDFDALRLRDSLGREAALLDAGALRARARGDAAAELVALAAHDAAAIRAGAADEHLRRRTVRATTAGVVVTPHPERLLGRHLAAGAGALTIADADSVELRVTLHRAGAAAARAGMPVRLVSHADVAHPIATHILSVAPRGGAAGGRASVEARVRVARGAAWRPGVTGEAHVHLGRSTLLGAAWRALRSRVRTDLLL